DDGVLFVAFFSTAELTCFLSLGWPQPRHVLDLYVETKWEICGIAGMPPKPSLIFALDRLGLGSLDIVEKQEMRELALRQGQAYSVTERRALLDYCELDVRALTRLLPAMLPRIDLPRALLRGRFMRAAALIEHNGIPVDGETLAALDQHWEALQLEMV